MTRNSKLRALRQGEQIHVMAETPTPDWVKHLLPVKIPLRKGFQGFRMFLIKQKYQQALAAVSTLEALQAFATGSGQQWSTRSVSAIASTKGSTRKFQKISVQEFNDSAMGIVSPNISRRTKQERLKALWLLVSNQLPRAISREQNVTTFFQVFIR